MRLPTIAPQDVASSLVNQTARLCYIATILSITLFIVYETAVQLSLQPVGKVNGGSLTRLSTADGAQVVHLWGQYSPYFDLPSNISRELPLGCRHTFAQLLSRHGARDPTALKSWTYRVLINRLQKDVVSFTGHYKFLQDYKYSLGADQLTAYGESELFVSGKEFYSRYHDLTTADVPFIRASGQERVVRSAQSFAKGYHDANDADKNASGTLPRPSIDVTIREEADANNTLNIKTCPAFSRTPNADVSAKAKSTWAATFVPPIQDRLNTALVGADLSIDDTIALMDLCPFETVAKSDSLQHSAFCGLFGLDEWKRYDYYQALDKYYGHGMGNPLAPTLGVGFVNELIARLTGRPVQDDTCTNRTLDSSASTFPLDGLLYADFSHDNDMEAIFAALGLYNNTNLLPLTHFQDAEHSAGFSASWTVPFAARLYVEKMQCVGDDEEFVRILLNNRVMPLWSCGMDSLGRCMLRDFVESLGFARSGGNWGECYAD